ncbi:TM2 domain-containing protein [Brevibacillus ginsengisoli]|uniref:TM2 domain-containing protein n=1 Tax=Brevibacillus ginsengisoli TaxID=363854 RepID=UPI003CED40EE
MNNSFSKMDLTLEELAILETEMLKKKKSKEAAWGLWAGLHFFGAHRFYTENYRYASAMFLSSSIPTIFIIYMLFTTEYYDSFNKFLMGFLIFLLSGSVIWSWIDAFFINKRIEELNEVEENRILKSIREQRNLRKPE